MDKAFEFYNYAKSWIGSGNGSETNRKCVWTSGMLFFEHNKRVYLDKAVILIGDIPPHFYNYFLNFSNWEIFEKSSVEDYQNQRKNRKEFYYMIDGDKVRVDPDKVYLHLKHTWANIDVDFYSNPSYWNFFVSHPNDKIFKHVADQIKDRVKVVDCSSSSFSSSLNSSFNKGYFSGSKKYTIKALQNPMFLKSHYYGSGNDVMDQALFTGLDPSMF